jgi:hypothetical protein
MKTTATILIALLGLLAGCENKEYFYNDVARVWMGEQITNWPYYTSSRLHSFKMIDAAQQDDTLYIPVHLTGYSTAVDRTVAVEVVAEDSNVPATAYAIGEAIIPAGTFHGQIPVVIQRAVPGLDLTRDSARLELRLVANEHFEPGGIPGPSTYTLLWCDFLTQPETWMWTGLPFSQARYKFVIDVTGETEFSIYQGALSRRNALLIRLQEALAEYNADPANAGRPEGWPYLDDDGTPLVF